MGKRRRKLSSNKTGALRGVLAPSFVDYGVVTNPFNNRYSYDNGPGSMTTRFKIKQQSGGSVSGIPVVIKGRPSYLYSKGRRIVPTTK